MRPAVLNDPRTRNLMGRLHGDFIKAIGLLELVWHFAADHAVDGLLTLSAVDELSRHLIWPKDPPSLQELLCDSGWAISGESGLLLSDWTENRPAHLVERMRKRQNRPVSRDTGQIQPTVPGQTGDVPGQKVEVKVDVPGQEEVKGGFGGFLRTEEKRALADRQESETQKAKPSGAVAVKKAPSNKYPDASAVVLPSDFDTIEVFQALTEYLAHRRALKHPITARGLELKMAEFRGRPDLYVAAVKRSIANGWKGVFHDKDQPGGSNGKSTVRPGQQFDPNATCDFETAFD